MSGSSRPPTGACSTSPRTGEFREDLYYRLNVFPIYVPPLRERLEDMPALVDQFIARFAAEAGKRVIGISDAALELLSGYNWPGNIRQLENAVYRAVVLSDGAILETADFPQIVAQAAGRDDALKLTEGLPVPSAPVHIDDVSVRKREAELKEAVHDRFLDGNGEVAALTDLERELIAFALQHYGGRMSRVARALEDRPLDPLPQAPRIRPRRRGQGRSEERRRLRQTRHVARTPQSRLTKTRAIADVKVCGLSPTHSRAGSPRDESRRCARTPKRIFDAEFSCVGS